MMTWAQIKGAVALSSLVVTALFGWALKVQTDRLVDARAERDAARATAQLNAQAAKDLAAQRDRDLASLSKLQQNLNQTRDLASQAIERLEELKRNEAMVQADPHGVRDRINDRIHSLFVDLSCASGRTGNDCASPATPTGAAKPARDRSAGAGASDSGRSP